MTKTTKVQSGAKLDVDSADFFQRTVDAPKEAVSRQGGAWHRSA